MTQKGEGYGSQAIATKEPSVSRELYLKRQLDKQDQYLVSIA
jgi:hypothetical protein